MKTTRLPLLLAGFLSLSSLLHAQTITSGVPGFISYQGRVLDSAGAPVGTGTPVNRTVVFRVWDHPSNTLAANLIYSEQQTVTIADGKFSVLVGQGVATAGTQFLYSETSKGPPASIANAFNGSGRYLGVTVDDGTVAVDNEIAPRQQVVTSAFAFRSKFAETLGTNNTTALTVLDSGNIGVGNTSPTGRFTVTAPVTSTTTINPQFLLTDSVDPNESLRIGVDSTGSAGNGSGFLQSWKEGTGATNLLLNPNGGNVGIGTTTPITPLHLRANSTAEAGSSGMTIEQAGTGDAALSFLITNTARFNIGIDNSDGDKLKIFRDVGNNFSGSGITIDGSSNVGIGTQSPAGRLHVVDHQLGIYTSTGVSGGWSRDGLTVTAASDAGYSSMVIDSGHSAVTDRGLLNVKRTGISQFYVRMDGNVGIGTTAPDARLVVTSNTASSANNTAVFVPAGISGQIHSHIHYGTTGDIYWRSGNSAGKVILQDSGGNVGIGTASPTVAKLVVNGVGGAENLGSHYTYANTGVIAAPGSFTNIGGISIKASDAVHAAFYRALSDARIKVIVGVSNGVEDLATLSQIEITDYTHKDVIGKGKDRSKKVIAQQVEKVFPQAVTKTVDVVPDIYKSARIVDGWIELPTDLKKGERVRLIGENHDEIHEVLEVEKDRFLTAYRPAPKSDAKATGSPIATDTPKDGSKTKAARKVAAGKDQSAVEADRIFVFGREAKDFRVVDYEAIAMLNVSATQELARKLAASEAAVKALQKENATLREKEETNAKRLAEMTATDKAFEAKLTALEKRLSTGKADLKTVSTQ